MLRLPGFEFRRPENVGAAAEILAGEGNRAMLVAGGTDLWPKMKRRQLEPRVVVGLRHLTSLRQIEGEPDNGIRIGANMTLRQLERDPMLLSAYPAVAEAARSISSPPPEDDGDDRWKPVCRHAVFLLRPDFRVAEVDRLLYEEGRRYLLGGAPEPTLLGGLVDRPGPGHAGARGASAHGVFAGRTNPECRRDVQPRRDRVPPKATRRDP